MTTYNKILRALCETPEEFASIQADLSETNTVIKPFVCALIIFWLTLDRLSTKVFFALLRLIELLMTPRLLLGARVNAWLTDRRVRSIEKRGLQLQLKIVAEQGKTKKHLLRVQSDLEQMEENAVILQLKTRISKLIQDINRFQAAELAKAQTSTVLAVAAAKIPLHYGWFNDRRIFA